MTKNETFSEKLLLGWKALKRGNTWSTTRTERKKKHHKKIRNMRETTCGIVDGGDEFIFS